MSNAIIQAVKLEKAYKDGNTTIKVLDKIDISIDPGDRVAIVGPSGSGKSTLLHLLGGLDFATKGDVLISGENWQNLKEKNRCFLRNQKLGFVYQFHHLLPEFSALENVAMPLLMQNIPIKEASIAAKEILVKVGLQKRVQHKPAQLSGGERARVAIARAMVHKPACILADEPTGNLDQITAMKVFDLMLEINSHVKTSLIIVTHDKSIASKMDKTFTLADGKLELQ